ncbi:hypothetical protein SAMN04487944_115130 [Gracilibacillus ureilyticus]|uniref:Uncharacterized protein n=1 Tax=Gracilibacillus ureilyticus TaxID=531814 RepID=A0A1H9U246_9BACI|nr:hypothetical protein [Gracilibacillus ureilyticus]SES03237.1 hypothetical protein SAMN04487944_115130 [Gracilibacillus ureilyticus]
MNNTYSMGIFLGEYRDRLDEVVLRMNIEIKPAKDLGEISKKKISEIFVDAFGKDLIFFSKDKTKLVRAFQHMFNFDVFYCALIDGEIAGITACTDGKVHSV